MRQSKRLRLSTNVDQNYLETEFLIAICRPTCDKWQSKTPFLSILIRVRRLLRAFSIAAYPVWIWRSKVCMQTPEILEIQLFYGVTAVSGAQGLEYSVAAGSPGRCLNTSLTRHSAHKAPQDQVKSQVLISMIPISSNIRKQIFCLDVIVASTDRKNRRCLVWANYLLSLKAPRKKCIWKCRLLKSSAANKCLK